MPPLRARLEAIIRADPNLMSLLACLRGLALPQWRLVAGAIYQTVWNSLSGFPRGTGIKDYDVIYFDDADLSFAAEDKVIRDVAEATSGFVGVVEVRNQARVHLWYERRFGAAYPKLRSADEALGLYASTAHAVGVRLERGDRLDIVAPFGLDDLFDMVLRRNSAGPGEASHAAKAARIQAIWPSVKVIE